MDAIAKLTVQPYLDTRSDEFAIFFFAEAEGGVIEKFAVDLLIPPARIDIKKPEPVAPDGFEFLGRQKVRIGKEFSMRLYRLTWGPPAPALFPEASRLVSPSPLKLFTYNRLVGEVLVLRTVWSGGSETKGYLIKNDALEELVSGVDVIRGSFTPKFMLGGD